MRALLVSASMCVLLLHCAPGPTATIDLSKTRRGLQLTDGSSISKPGDDDYAPTLVRTPSDNLVLVFASDRSCGGCTAGEHHLFVAESAYPYYGGTEIPAFNPPVVLQQSGSPHAIAPRSAVYATWTQGMLQIFVKLSNNNNYGLAVSEANLATGTTITPDPLPNTSQTSNRLLHVDIRNIKLIASNGSNALKANVLTVDSGTPLDNPWLAYAEAIAPVPSFASGYLDAYFIAAGGRIRTGTLDYDFGEHEQLNTALENENLYVTAISTLRTMFGASDMIAFSAGESPAAPQDLYLVSSHDVNMLWTMTFNFGFDYSLNPGPYRIFTTNQSFDGGIGGIYMADYYCSQDGGAPDLNVNYKAMLGDSTARSGAIGSQVDWVLTPFETYLRASDGVTLFTADADGLFAPSSLPSGAFSSGGVTVWTGLTSSWAPTTNCSNWTDGVTGTGQTGLSSAQDPTLIQNSGPLLCTNTYRIYCVEQPF